MSFRRSIACSHWDCKAETSGSNFSRSGAYHSIVIYRDLGVSEGSVSVRVQGSRFRILGYIIIIIWTTRECVYQFPGFRIQVARVVASSLYTPYPDLRHDLEDGSHKKVVYRCMVQRTWFRSWVPISGVSVNRHASNRKNIVTHKQRGDA